MDSLKQTDFQIYDIIQREKQRLQWGLELIPSENFVSKAVLEALGSVLTNKYSEGYPKKRYYGGNQYIDMAEQLAIDRAKKLFNAEHANVQPYSGSPANLEVYFALLQPGDKILAMSLAHGGHLTHGYKINFSGKLYNAVFYGVDKRTERINMREVREIAKREQPKLIICGSSAYPRQIDFEAFSKIAKEVNALAMADIAHIAGLIAANCHPQPFPYMEVVTTTTHKTLRGPRGAMILCKKELATKIDKAVFPGMQGGPHNHQTAAIAVALKEAMQPSFKEYAAQIISNAKALAEELKANKLRLVSGGTDNHLMLIDLSNTKCTGKKAEEVLDEVNITVNKNMIPFDKHTPIDPSGIRIGTPALTTRGMKEQEMKKIAKLIAKVLNNPDNPTIKSKVHNEVLDLCKKFPLPIN